mmetsp:Transcript_15714/g.35231  ORF Transcript_15714/g.35231 Transcript_15714/m.35231 type:complete len:225 (+) Transcript_15714:432-1106(+)
MADTGNSTSCAKVLSGLDLSNRLILSASSGVGNKRRERDWHELESSGVRGGGGMTPRGKDEGSLPPGNSRWDIFCPFRRTLFQWFLIALSVLPERYLAMSDHLLPKWPCSSRSIRSSSCVHGSFFTASSRWLCHLSRHCLPDRPGSFLATSDHARTPSIATSCRTMASSACVHGLRCTRCSVACASEGEEAVASPPDSDRASPPDGSYRSSTSSHGIPWQSSER